MQQWQKPTQLNSMPLSQLAMDDSSPPIVHCGMQVPIAASTPQVQMYTYTVHSRKTLINRLSQVILKVYYTLHYHHLIQEKELQIMRYNHFVMKCQRALISTYNMLNSAML